MVPEDLKSKTQIPKTKYAFFNQNEKLLDLYGICAMTIYKKCKEVELL